MTNINKVLTAIGVVGIMSMTAMITIKEPAMEGKPAIVEIEELAVCETEVTLNVKEEKGKVTERLCMSNMEYANLKTTFLTQYNDKTKDYDFDVNGKDVLSAVLNKEIVNMGGITFENGATKEEIKQAFINLLK